MAFPRGEEPSLDVLRESSGVEGLGGDEDYSSGEDIGAGGGELPDADGPAGGDDRGGEDERGERGNVAQALRQYREDLKRERAEREADRAELREMRQWRAEVQASIREARAAEARAAAEAARNADPEPDSVLEPDKHDEWSKRQEQKRFDEVNQNLQQTQRQIAEQRQQIIATNIENSVRDSIMEFSRQNPDYDAAYNFLIENVANEYRRKGYTDQQIFGEGGALYHERDTLFRRIIQIDGAGNWRWSMSPAAALYDAALRYGWNKDAAARQQATQPAQQQRRPAGTRRPGRNPQALERAAAAAAGAGGGASVAGEQLTAEKMLNMSPRERTWLEHNRPDLVERILSSVS